MQGGAKGPGACSILGVTLNLFYKKDINLVSKFLGIFFILPCIDAYARVDLRTRTYDVPPQEVRMGFIRV